MAMLVITRWYKPLGMLGFGCLGMLGAWTIMKLLLVTGFLCDRAWDNIYIYTQYIYIQYIYNMYVHIHIHEIMNTQTNVAK